MRRLLATKGETHGEFAARYGITESQLYNWFKRQEPPLPKHWDRLAKHFGVTREEIAFGSQLISEPKTPQVHEDQAPYGALREVTAEEAEASEADDIEDRIRARVEATIAAAGKDVGRLGWIREQAEQHLRPPDHWASGLPEPKRRPATVVLVPRPQALPQRHGQSSG